MSIADSLEKVMKFRSINAAKLAVRSGVSTSRISDILNEKTLNPRFDTLSSLAKALDISVEELTSDEGVLLADDYMETCKGAYGEGMTILDPGESYVKVSEYIELPRYEVQASAGGGAMVTSEQIVDYLLFKPDWLKNAKGISPENILLISVIGDSMEPTLSDGDLIAVDTTEGRFKSDAVYVLQQGDRLLVKRIHYKIDGSVLIKSDNSKRYDPETFRGDQLDNLKVVGRVVWRGGDL